MDFLVHMSVSPIPDPAQEADLREREAKRAADLADAGVLRRLWRVPGRRANWGLWSAPDADALHAALASLPLFPHLDITVHPLAGHPNDPDVMAAPAPSGGLPGLRGGDHVGLTVPDIEAATRFFVDVIGCTPFYDLGPIASADGWMSEHLGVDDRAVIRKLRFLRCGAGLNIELFEYEAPDQRRQAPRNSDWGGHHIALYVDDFEAALAHLRAHGVKVLGAPTRRDTGPSAGLTWVYFEAPWGLTLELVSYPDGKAYERDTSARLWHPAHPAD